MARSARRPTLLRGVPRQRGTTGLSPRPPCTPPRALPAPSLHPLCALCTRCVPARPLCAISFYTLSAPPPHPSAPSLHPSAPSLHPLCTLSAPSLHPLCTLSAPSLHPLCTLSASSAPCAPHALATRGLRTSVTRRLHLGRRRRMPPRSVGCSARRGYSRLSLALVLTLTLTLTLTVPLPLPLPPRLP